MRRLCVGVVEVGHDGEKAAQRVVERGLERVHEDDSLVQCVAIWHVLEDMAAGVDLSRAISFAIS